MVDAALNTLSTEELEKPDQPEILRLLRQSRRFNIPLFNGSYQEWPYLFTLELDACIDAEIEYEELKLINALLAKKANDEAAQPASG